MREAGFDVAELRGAQHESGKSPDVSQQVLLY